MSETCALLEESDPKDMKKMMKGLAASFGLVFGIVGGLACVILMDQIAPDFQLNSLRFMVGLTFSIFFLIFKRKLPKIEKKNIKWQILVAIFNLSLNVGSYSHYLKVITFTGTRSLQIGFGIIFSLMLSKTILKVKIHSWKMLIVVFIISGVSMVLSSQNFQKSDCLETNQARDIQNMSVSTTLLVEINGLYFINNLENGSTTDAQHSGESGMSERSSIGSISNSSEYNMSLSIPKGTSLDFNMTEPCRTSITTVVAIIVISLGTFCSCMESITIAGTGLKEESPIALSFWNYVFGVTFSLGFHFIFEHTIIPDNTTDILLNFGHAVLASGVTYFDILALQNIDVHLRYITTSLTLPLSFVLQLTILHNVSPRANMWSIG